MPNFRRSVRPSRLLTLQPPSHAWAVQRSAKPRVGRNQIKSARGEGRRFLPTQEIGARGRESSLPQAGGQVG